MSAVVTLALLFFLSVALNEQVTEGCSCLPRRPHPQQHFCASDVVIRAKVIGKVTRTLPGLTAYKIQPITTFKQLDKKKIKVIYTSQTSCGIDLINGEYLLSGHVKDGRVVVNLCDRVERWDSISSVQKLYFSMYQRGCVCEISPCTGASCLIKMLQKKCLMKVDDSSSLDYQEARFQSICLPGHGGFCSWQEIIVD